MKNWKSKLRGYRLGNKKVIAQYLGIDEAHRGSLLGPMVVAGYLGPRRNKLKDSKKLAPDIRRRIFDEILPVADLIVIVIGNRLINLSKLSMDKIERLAFLFLIALSEGAEEIFIDRVGGLKEFLQGLLDQGKLHYEPDMEDKEKTVAGASICAKEIGDEIIKRLGEIAGVDLDQLAKGYWPTEEIKKKMKSLQRHRWKNRFQEETKIERRDQDAK